MIKSLYILIIMLLVFSNVSYSQHMPGSLFAGTSIRVSNVDKINTPDSDISPTMVEGKLHWTSVKDQYQGDKSREQQNVAFYSTYYTPLNAQGYVVGRRIPVSGFGQDYHEGPVSWCSSTGELFSTLSNVISPQIRKGAIKKEAIRLRLVIQEKVEGKWQITSEFPYNDNRYHLAHPAISPGGDTLVFSSDLQRDNLGQNDLYMSVLKSGKWGEPVNLGAVINTKGNEMFPTFLPGGLLSFASDGHNGGQGGLDIWYVKFPEPGEVYNAGGEINTPSDDFGLIILPGNKTGYFSSKQTGNDDIYRVDLTGGETMQVFRGTVVDHLSGEPLPGSRVVLYDCQGKETASVNADAEGNFEMTVPENSCPVLIASKSGYNDEKMGIENMPTAVLRMKRGTAKEKPMYELQVLDAETLQPIPGTRASCSGVRDWESDAQGLIRAEPAQIGGCNLLVKKEGYLLQTFVADPSRLTGGRTRETVYLFKKELNKTYVLRNIFYDFDKWDILPESETELNNLIKIMNDNPDIKVELGSHTDARGSDEYNRSLSQRRSDSAVGYILSRGIPSSRIVARGYGETQLVNHCRNGVNCTDEVHRQNRRTEFKIIGM